MSYPGLERVFQWRVEVPEEQLLDLVALLVRDDDTVINGSSFAVTSRARDGHRILWLSDASEKRLRQSALPTGLAIVPTNEE